MAATKRITKQAPHRQDRPEDRAIPVRFGEFETVTLELCRSIDLVRIAIDRAIEDGSSDAEQLTVLCLLEERLQKVNDTLRSANSRYHGNAVR